MSLMKIRNLIKKSRISVILIFIITFIILFGIMITSRVTKTYTLQAVCDENQLKSLVELLKPNGIKDIVRSGAVSILSSSAV